MTTRVKICGITRVEDAQLAARLGAHAIGFVFWPASPRAIDLAGARAVAAALPDRVQRVGVFVDAAPEEVADVARQVPLDVVQLHGDETVAAFRPLGLELFKSAALDSDAALAAALALPDEIVPLVDAADRVARGGTGRRADWDRAAQLAAARRVVLAGGLTPANVGDAIRRVRPWAVDVSSGVEERPGVKHAEIVQQFFDAVAAADREGI